MAKKDSARKINELIQELGKIPPQALDLEEQLLGSIMLLESLDYCYKTIKADEFYKDVHRQVYEAMETLYKNKDPINIETVSYTLKQKDLLDVVGGPYFLSQLSNRGTASSFGIDFNAKIIHQKFIARELIRITTEVQEKSFDQNTDVADLIDYLEIELMRIQKTNAFNIPKLMLYEKLLIKGLVLNSTLFIDYKSIVPDNFFVDEIHQKLWNVMKLLSDQNVEISLFSVEDILSSGKNDSSINYVKELLEFNIENTPNFEYLYSYLKKNYEKARIYKISNYLNEFKFKREPEDIVKKIEYFLDDIRTKDTRIVDFSAHIDSTFHDIVSSHQSGNKNILETGYAKLDRTAMFSMNDLVIVGGAKGSGKTRFIIRLIFNILNNHKDMAACLICMEETADKIIRIFISMMTGLEDHQIQSKNYVLTEKDRNAIKEARKVLKSLDINIVDHPVSVKQAKAIYTKFVTKRPTKKCVLMLDNLMLLEDATSKIDSDDMIAKQLVYIKKETGALIFVLHHFTKEQANYINAIEGYRPKEGHLKGSTRYGDVADHIMLINKMSKYADLIKSQSIKPPINIDGKDISRVKILKELLIAELTKNRDGTDDEDERLIRFFAKLGTMSIREWR